MLKSIRILLSIAAYYDYEIWQMDVKTAFLNGHLDESIYMVQPEGFIDKGQEQKVCQLQKPFMDLSKLLDLGILDLMKRLNHMDLIKMLMSLVSTKSLSSVKKWLANQFQMKDLGEASYVLGIQLIRDRKNKLLALSQASYFDKMLIKFAMQNSKKGNLPTRHGVTLSKEQCPKTP
ncbi:hypothetical protein LWI29_016110 [Acer saccharum]|uniref:Reverse transcriptase Ty1/copia-type domain-containing protein n=1 Tax=Acer saccharum TaxID=4024 RepID=A0AA39S3P7_ACESA|nr:hypothetical protein LWI29_016110 [Acer saccharum]